MSFPILDPPQALRCIKCPHMVELLDPDQVPEDPTRKRKEHPTMPRCEKCGGVMRILCQAPPRAARQHRCLRFAEPGRRCKLHGKNAAKGTRQGKFKDGKRSKFMLARWADVYFESLDDPDAQRSQRHQLAVIAAMSEELLQRMETGESATAWQTLKRFARQMRRELLAIKQSATAGTPEAAAEAGALANSLMRFLETDLLPVIDGGVGSEAARMELVRLYKDRARLIKVEQEASKSVPLEVLFVQQAQILQIMMRHLHDQPRVRVLIAADMRDLAMPRGDAPLALPGKVDES